MARKRPPAYQQGTCSRSSGISASSLLLVTKKTLEVTVSGLQQTADALAAGCEKGLETVSELLAKWRGEMQDMHRDTKQQLEKVDDEVSEVKERVSEVADSVGRMSVVSAKANLGV